MSLAGRLDGYLDGRPLCLVAENCEITLIARRLRTLLVLRRNWRAFGQLLGNFLQSAGIRIVVRMKWFGKVEVFPRPNYLTRLLLPRTRQGRELRERAND